jgi:PAS domain S-box-containing protein
METDFIRQVHTTFFHRAVHGTAILNRQAMILQANEALSQLSETPLSKLIGMSFYSFAPSEDQHNQREHIDMLFTSNQGERRFDIRWQLPNGNLLPVQIALQRIDSDSCQVEWLVAVVRERKPDPQEQTPGFSVSTSTVEPEACSPPPTAYELEESPDSLSVKNPLSDPEPPLVRPEALLKLMGKLYLQKWLFEYIHSSFNDIVCTLRSDGSIVSLSPSFFTLTGYSQEELLALSPEDIVPTEDILLLRSHLVASPNLTRPISIGCRARDGSFLWLEVVIAPLPEELDEAGHFIIVARNQTEKMTVHEQAVNSDKLTAAGGLAAGIAHEIRNPLTAIKGFIQLMKSGTVKAEFHDIILSELARIDTIIGELLVLSKPHEFAYSQTDLYAILGSVVTLINTQALLHNIEIELCYGTDLVQLYCDENQIKQVLINLLKNAIEAMPAGGQITIETHHAGSNSILILIRDQGVGISVEDMEKIGQMFYTTKESGTGLGMMISHEIIRNHGGRMTLRSTQGVGTAVEIILPLAR